MKFEEVAKGLMNGKSYKRRCWHFGVYIKRQFQESSILLFTNGGALPSGSMRWDPDLNDLLAEDWEEIQKQTVQQSVLVPIKIDSVRDLAGNKIYTFSYQEKVDSVQITLPEYVKFYSHNAIGLVD